MTAFHVPLIHYPICELFLVFPFVEREYVHESITMNGNPSIYNKNHIHITFRPVKSLASFVFQGTVNYNDSGYPCIVNILSLE